MKKINFAWNNTDWSVSNSEIRTMTATRAEQTMKTPAHIEKDNARFLKAFPQLAEPKPVCADSIDPAIEHARREAAALAWSTDYPFLVLPCLTEELERKVVAYSEKQRQVREHSELLFPTAFPIAAQQIAA